MKKSLTALIFGLMVVSFVGCGYSSISNLTNEKLGKRINASGEIDPANVHTSIDILDNFYDYLQNSLGKVLDSSADVSIRLKVVKTDFTPLYLDDLGYAKSYRADVVLDFLINSAKYKNKLIRSNGHYVFNTNAISTLSDDERSFAILQASRSAMAEFATKLGALK